VAGVEPYSTSRRPIRLKGTGERTQLKCACVRQSNLYIGVICFDSSRAGSSSAKPARRDSPRPTPSSGCSHLHDNQNSFVFGTNPLGIEYDGQVLARIRQRGPREQSGTGGRRRGRLVVELNWTATGASRAPSPARLGNRDRDSVQDAPLPDGKQSHLGLQRQAQHPPEEQQVYLSAGAAGLRHLTGCRRRRS